MKKVLNFLVLLLSIAAVAAGDKKEDKQAFRPKPAAEYPTRQTIGKVTIAAVPFESDEQTKPVFAKINPNQYGVLPVLVVIENGGDQALALNHMKVEYLAGDRTRLEPTPPEEVPYVVSPERPQVVRTPSPLPSLGRSKKNPLAIWEIEGRAFRASMIPPGETAFGFFYFQTRLVRTASLYISGIRQASTGEELFYFEIPLLNRP